MKKFAIAFCSIVFMMLAGLILLLALPSGEKQERAGAVEKSKFNQTEYNQLEKKIVDDSQGAILKIERNDIIFDVTVHDDWNKLSKSDRETVLNEIYKKIRNISVASELIGPNSNIDVLLINLNGKKLANKDAFGDVEIYE